MSDETPKAGVKNDKGKVKFHLVPIEPLWALAKLYTVGAVKYTAWNWASGMSWGRLYDAMTRHSGKWLNRQKFDLKDGQHHLIAVAWCAFTLYVYELFGLGVDDRATYNLKRPAEENMDPALKSLYEPDELEPESVTSLMAVAPAAAPGSGNDQKKVFEAVFKEFDNDNSDGDNNIDVNGDDD